MKPEELLERCLEDLRERCGVSAQDHVIAGVSGGADSTALVELFVLASRRWGLSVEVVVVDHHLRPGSTDEARNVASRCRRRGFATRVVPVDVVGRARRERRCLEEAARLERHECLESVRAASGAEWIALGHTRTDLAETLIQRLHRGAGLDGIACMGPRLGRLVRPMLGVTRAEVRDLLRSVGIEWVEDPSNDDRRFERALLRGQLMPKLDAEALADVAEQAAAARAVLRAGEAAWCRRHGRQIPPGLAVPGGAPRWPPAVLARLSRRLWLDLPEGRRPPSRRATRELLDVVAGARGEARLPGVVALRFGGAKGTLALLSTMPPEPSDARLVACGPGRHRSEELRLTAVVGAGRPLSPLWGAVPGDEPIEIRGRRAGDRVRGSRMKLSRRLARQGVPRHLRDWVPVVATAGQVCWSANAPERRRGDRIVSLCLDLDHPLRMWADAIRGSPGASSPP